jgi:3-hydroxyacyl-CoA dehydrogenase
MTSPVTLEDHGGIAALVVNNPPVNALGIAVRQGLRDGMREIAAGRYSATVIACVGRTFVSGADIREF